MRKLIFLLYSLPAFAAIQNTMQWDVRTTGSDSNGGGFDSAVGSPGTDESMANSGTSMTVTIGGTTTQGTSSPVFSSTTHGPGNVLHIISGSGCTVGWFEELSQSSGTATFDRALGTAASTCTATIGGSFATLCSAWSAGCSAGALSVAVSASVGSYNTIWMKTGTYGPCTSLSNSACFQNTSQVGNQNFLAIHGYSSTHGDTGTATITCTANSTNMFGAQGNSLYFYNLNFTLTAGTPFGILAVGSNAGYGNPTIFVQNSTFDISGSTGGQGFYNDTGSASMTIWDSEFILNSTGTGIEDKGGNSGQLWVRWSYFTGAGTAIWDGNTAPSPAQKWNIEGNVFASNSRGVYCQNSSSCPFVLLSDNDCYLATSECVKIVNTGMSRFTAVNNIFWGGTYGINLGGKPTVVNAQSNAYGNQGTGTYNNFVAGLNSSDVTLTQNPYTNAGSNDFSLNSTAGGGASLKGVGFPGTNYAGTGYMSIGALQPQINLGTAGGPKAFVQ